MQEAPSQARVTTPAAEAEAANSAVAKVARNMVDLPHKKTQKRVECVRGEGLVRCGHCDSMSDSSGRGRGLNHKGSAKTDLGC